MAFYTRTGNIGGILSRTTSTDTFYYHYDGNGNVVSLTDVSENVVATYEYDAYGNLQSSSGAEANNNPFQFSTKYFDSASGFYDYGFRFYDPVTGRWLSRDPIAEDGGLNLYGFVGNGPVNAWDEYGLIDDGAPADIDEQIGRIRRAYRTTVRVAATTTNHAYSIMYGELPKQLMFGSVLRGIGLIRTSGSVVKNALLAKEYAFAKRIVDFQGGKFVGALKKGQAGIDGYINGVPCSLKQFTGKSLKGVLKHASDAERSARNARYAGVELFIEANNVSKGPLIDFIRKGPLSQIPSQGTIRAITIFTKDGVIRIVGN